jgi:hypothetical protein
MYFLGMSRSLRREIESHGLLLLLLLLMLLLLLLLLPLPTWRKLHFYTSLISRVYPPACASTEWHRGAGKLYPLIISKSVSIGWIAAPKEHHLGYSPGTPIY